MTAFHPQQLLPALALAVALVLPPAGRSPAQTLCSRPVAPICATTIPATGPTAGTDPTVARQRCIEDADRYLERLRDYRQCLEGSLAKAGSDVEATAGFIRCLKDAQPDCRLRGTR